LTTRRLFLATLAVLSTAPLLARAAELPDLKGRSVVVVTENAYPPLQFIDPKSGDAIGWEYDAMKAMAERLNFKLEYRNISWDAMIQAVSDGQYDIGMTGISIKDERKAKVDFSDPYMKCSYWCVPTKRASPTQRALRPSKKGWSEHRQEPPPFIRPSTIFSMAMNRTPASGS